MDGGAPEAVDGLVVVAHHADVAVTTGQQGGQVVLEGVGVLILVDEDIVEFVLVVFPHVLVLIQQADGVEDQVVKVQRPRVPKALLIFYVYLRYLEQIHVSGGLLAGQERLGQQLLVLGLGDLAQNGPGGKDLVVHVLGLQDLLDDPERVVGVVDGKGLVKAQLVRVPAQDAQTGGVEGGGPDVVGGVSQFGGQPLLQLPGGFVGEGDGQNRPGGGGVQGAELAHAQAVGAALGGDVVPQKEQIVTGDPGGAQGAVRAAAVGDEVGDAVDEHGGLAAARSRQQ